MRTVAALYVDPKGPYAVMDGVDLWDEPRDARKYNGPFPCVAHPPCNRWGKMAPVNLARWGTPIGEDGGCFEKALLSVRKWGGVLEHPHGSLAWKEFSLEKPKGLSWNRVSPTEWVGEVWQSDYGHLATKKTWLLYVGNTQPKPYLKQRTKGTHQVGGGIHTGNNKKPRLNQSLTHLTPPKFADYLVELARESNL
jgi:hypothetical protein